MDNRNILGIDIGTSMVKVFVGTLATDGSTLILGNGMMPTQGFVKGIVTDVQALAMSIHQAVECAVIATNISVKDAYIGISGVDIHSVNSIGSVATENGNSITDKDITRLYQSAILASVAVDQEVLHIVPKRFLVDKQEQIGVPIQQTGAHLEVEAHIVTMPKIIIKHLIDALESLDIHVVGIVANPVVALKTLPTAPLQNTLFIDIGAGTTDLIVYSGEKIDFSVSLPLGGEYITSDIMKGFGVSYHHGEEIKKYYGKLDKNLRGQNIILDFNDYGTTDKQFAYDFLYDIIESRIDEIIYLIKDSLNTVISEHEIERIFLTGGCGAMPSVGDSVEKLFGVSAQVITLDELPLEYVGPANVACYGVLTYATKNMPDIKDNQSNSIWQSLVSTFRNLFNS